MQNKQDTRTEKRKIGDLGEKIAGEWLEKKSFEILEKNYLKKWGEIDIIAIKKEILHFVEVKTVKRDLSVIRETKNTFRPEENVHKDKLRRLKRTIMTYIAERNLENRIWEFDVAVLYLDVKSHRAKVSI